MASRCTSSRKGSSSAALANAAGTGSGARRNIRPAARPSAVSGASPGQINLTWTSPGDDGAGGLVLLGQYDIFYSTNSAAVASTTTAQVSFSTAMVTPPVAVNWTGAYGCV